MVNWKFHTLTDEYSEEFGDIEIAELENSSDRWIEYTTPDGKVYGLRAELIAGHGGCFDDLSYEIDFRCDNSGTEAVDVSLTFTGTVDTLEELHKDADIILQRVLNRLNETGELWGPESKLPVDLLGQTFPDSRNRFERKL